MKKQTALLAILGLASGVFAQSTIIYSPAKAIKDQALSLKSWGSGTISETDEVAFEGVYSLRISMRNYFQGGSMNLERPIDLSQSFADSNNLLRFAVRVADSNLTLGGTGGGGGAPSAGGTGGGKGGGAAGGGAPTGGQGGGQTGTTASLAPEATQLRNLRVIVSTTDGKKSEIYLPINTVRLGGKTWIMAAAPLKAISGLSATNKMVNGIAVSGDAIATIYVGDVRVINDSTPINGEMEPNQTRNLALGDEIEFRGRGFGGASVLKYSWDFDSKDGIQVDAEGAVIKRRFRAPGEYTVTLTISDVYGLKAPYTTSVKLKVNP